MTLFRLIGFLLIYSALAAFIYYLILNENHILYLAIALVIAGDFLLLITPKQRPSSRQHHENSWS